MGMWVRQDSNLSWCLPKVDLADLRGNCGRCRWLVLVSWDWPLGTVLVVAMMNTRRHLSGRIRSLTGMFTQLWPVFFTQTTGLHSSKKSNQSSFTDHSPCSRMLVDSQISCINKWFAQYDMYDNVTVYLCTIPPILARKTRKKKQNGSILTLPLLPFHDNLCTNVYISREKFIWSFRNVCSKNSFCVKYL